MKLKYLVLLLFFPLTLSAQQEITMTMDECIKMASQQSLDAFVEKNTYLSSYWRYRGFQASRLPSLLLKTTPISYNNNYKREYENGAYETVKIETIKSEAQLKIQQKVGLTGGTFSLSSGNIFDKSKGKSNSFRSTPLQASYNQNLNGYNSLKWRAKIDPEKYELAKREYIEKREGLSKRAISSFFNLINSQINLNISTRNLTNAEELFKISKGRFEVGTITQDELLTLELGLYNSQLAKIKAEQSLLRARINLNIFLNIDKSTIINCVIPEDIPGIEISMGEAINLALQNNSKTTDFHIRALEAEKNVKAIKAENRFTSDLTLSYGVAGNNPDFIESYDNLSKNQGVNLTFNIPIIDWGAGKGAVAVAKSAQEIQRLKVEQERIAFEQDVSANILEFNLQKAQVENSAKADTIGQKGYDISYEIFKLGKLDVIKLNQARNDQEEARKAYINSLNEYWTKWYTIRQQTLYDFENEVTLSEDFDALINM